MKCSGQHCNIRGNSRVARDSATKAVETKEEIEEREREERERAREQREKRRREKESQYEDAAAMKARLIRVRCAPAAFISQRREPSS